MRIVVDIFAGRGIFPLALVIHCLAGNSEGALRPGPLGLKFFLKGLKKDLD